MITVKSRRRGRINPKIHTQKSISPRNQSEGCTEIEWNDRQRYWLMPQEVQPCYVPRSEIARPLKLLVPNSKTRLDRVTCVCTMQEDSVALVAQVEIIGHSIPIKSGECANPHSTKGYKDAGGVMEIDGRWSLRSECFKLL